MAAKENIAERVTAEPGKIQLAGERPTLARTELKRFFEAAVKFEASDLFLRGGERPRLRIRSTLQTMDVPIIEAERFEEVIFKGLGEAQWARYDAAGSLDVSLDLDGKNRFRVNIFRSRGAATLAARRINPYVGTFEELNLPPMLRNLCNAKHGVVLVVGVTGSGKSTTLAAMVQEINRTRKCHIVTAEYPIEYIFNNDQAMISQREVGTDVPSFADALRDVVRASPDVVLIGEMRDRDTVEAAVRAAETGHLVFSTIHASSASQAFGRLYNLFPQEERDGIRNMLAYQILAVISQKLLPTVVPAPAQVPAVEVLLQSPPTRKYILEGREHELSSVIPNYKDGSMLSLSDSLAELVKRELIEPQTAIAAAHTPDEIKTRLRAMKLI